MAKVKTAEGQTEMSAANQPAGAMAQRQVATLAKNAARTTARGALKWGSTNVDSTLIPDTARGFPEAFQVLLGSCSRLILHRPFKPTGMDGAAWIMSTPDDIARYEASRCGLDYVDT